MELKNLEKEMIFYEERFFFSYSSLSLLLNAPKEFYKRYILNQRDDTRSPAALRGSVVHCLLLEPHNFDIRFVIAPEKTPSDTACEVIKAIYQMYLLDEEDSREELTEYTDEVLVIMENLDYYTNIKNQVSKAGKVISPSGIEYFDYLKNSEGRDLVDIELYSQCVDIVEVLKNDSSIALFGFTPAGGEIENLEVRSEIEIVDDNPEKGYGLKGHVDNITIDQKNKKINVTDLKTTSKVIEEFPEIVNLRDYWMQAAIYYRLVKAALTAEGLTEENGWTYAFHFVVIDKYNHVYDFEVTEDTMHDWLIDLEEKLKMAEYHYDNREYSLPFNMLQKKVKL